MVRRDEYFERFREMTSERGWTEEQQMFIGRLAVSGYGSTETLVRIADQIFQIEDGLAAERGDAIIQYERVFNRAGFARQQQAEQLPLEGGSI